MHVSPSPDTSLSLEQAREEVAYATKALALTSERMSMKLATESEVSQAENAKTRAQGMLDNLLARGLSKPTDIQAAEDGIVTSLVWSPGSIVSAGTPLVQVVPIGKLQVVMWIEAEEISDLSSGQEVVLSPVERGLHLPATGVIRTIAHQVDATTRLVEVTVNLTGDGLLLGQYVRGRVRVDSPPAMLVARSALLETSDGIVLFTVDQGIAHEPAALLGVVVAETDGVDVG